jgi:hypothetical protein
MNDGICKDMDGAKCAGDYCDYWDHEEQSCSIALESKLRVEILRATLARMGKPTSDTEEVDAFQKLSRHMNIVEGTSTKQ